MRRTLFLALATVGLLVTIWSSASAANVQLKGRSGLTLTDTGTTLTASGALTGLGGGDVVISLTATGTPLSTCTNPHGSVQPAGQNPAPTTFGGSLAIPKNEIKNGNLTFSVATAAPQSPVPGAPACPNSQWTQRITDVAFTSATLTVQQDGQTVLTKTCTFSATTNGQRITCP